MDWYHQLFLLREGGKTWPSPPPTVLSPHPPHPHRSFSSISLFLCLFCHLFTTQEYTHQSPGGERLNESRDSVHTLCCKKHCSSPQFFGELPLCCLNVYMEQLGGLKTDVWSKNTALVQSLFSLDGSNDTILGAFQIASRNDTLMKRLAQHLCSLVKNDIRQIKWMAPLHITLPTQGHFLLSVSVPAQSLF